VLPCSGRTVLLARVEVTNKSSAKETWTFQAAVFPGGAVPLTVQGAVGGPPTTGARWAMPAAGSASPRFVVPPGATAGAEVRWDFVDRAGGRLAPGDYFAMVAVRMLPHGVPSGVGGLRLVLAPSGRCGSG
jgi:hypothetical protein